MKVICISGKAQSGKDTFAELVYENLTGKGKKAIIIHYADLLKYICRTFFNWDGDKSTELGRSLLQYIGTDVVRAKQPDFWVDFVKAILNLFPEKWEYAIIPDARFENEITVLSNDETLDVVSVRVERENYDNGLSEEQRSHRSENSLDEYPFDYYIENNQDMSALKDAAELFTTDIMYNL